MFPVINTNSDANIYSSPVQMVGNEQTECLVDVECHVSVSLCARVSVFLLEESGRKKGTGNR